MNAKVVALIGKSKITHVTKVPVHPLSTVLFSRNALPERTHYYIHTWFAVYFKLPANTYPAYGLLQCVPYIYIVLFLNNVLEVLLQQADNHRPTHDATKQHAPYPPLLDNMLASICTSGRINPGMEESEQQAMQESTHLPLLISTVLKSI